MATLTILASQWSKLNTGTIFIVRFYHSRESMVAHTTYDRDHFDRNPPPA